MPEGSEQAPFTLVEYGDYECPDCGRLFRALRNLQGQLNGRLRLVYRHYPLSGIHKHAQMAAEAAEAAGVVGAPCLFPLLLWVGGKHFGI